MTQAAKLTQGSIRRHLIEQTAPMLFGIASIISVGLVDTYYIGRLGPDPLAAVSFIFPVTVALSSLGVGVLAGISSVVARALGGDDTELAQHRGNLGLVLSILLGLFIAALLYIFKAPLFQLMQAKASLLPLIDAYMTPFALGFPLLLTNMGTNGILRGQGAAKSASAILISFAAANWILDPILIDGVGSWEGFGIEGAAYATIAGWLLGTLTGFALVQSSDLPLHPKHIQHPAWKTSLKALTRVGVPAALSNAINPVGLAVLTAILASYEQHYVAGFGAAGRLQTFAVVPLLALSSSIGAVVGQNWGAERAHRARSALLQANLFSIVYGFAVAALLVTFRSSIASFFTDDPNVLDAIQLYISIAAWGFAGYGVLVVTNGAFNAIDRASHALIISLARVFLVMIPVAYFAQPLLQASSIFTAELTANLIGGIASATLAWLVLRPKT